MEIYSLASHGYRDYGITKDGQVWSFITNTFLKPHINKRGYLTVTTSSGILKQPYVHQLVAKCFIPNPENKPQVNHIDGNKQNNHYTNLEWVTNQENATHSRLNGLMPHNLFSDEDVHIICRLLELGQSCTEISRLYGYSYDSVYQIKRGENWRHISCQYNLPNLRYRNKVLTESDVHKSCQLLMQGLTCRQIADMVGTSKSAIQKLSAGKSFFSIRQQYF